MASIHNRMPVILHSKDYVAWLDPSPQTAEKLNPLIKDYPAELMEAYPVSTMVNSPANDRAECVLPA
jgi:putative SOS response-associated peptidase YedK